MGDYFNNLLVRSFKPATAVQPLGATPMPPPTDAPDGLAPPTLEEFVDPFADPAVSTEEPGGRRPYSPHPPYGERQVRRPAAADQASGETMPVVSTHPVTAVRPAAESKTGPQPAAPRGRDVSHSADKPLPNPSPFAPPDAARPPAGEALRPINDEPPEHLRPTIATAADKAKGKELPRSAMNELANRVSSPPVIASAERIEVAPRKKVSAAEKVSPPGPLRPSSTAPLRLPQPELERRQAVVGRSVDPLDKEQSTPATLPALVPKHGEARATAAVVVKAQPNLLKTSAPDKAAADLSQPETIINVTIGRIEVRATPAKAPRPERRPSAPPVMSLDDYLRKRSGGKL